MGKESGVSPTFVAITTGVVVALGLWVFSASREILWENAHESLAEASFRALKANDPDIYADEMLRVWEILVKEEGYQNYYRQWVDFESAEELAEFKESLLQDARAVFKAARKASGAHFDWSDAEYDGPKVNEAPVSVNRLVGFYVKANNKRYAFKYVKPRHCLHYLQYKGPDS